MSGVLTPAEFGRLIDDLFKPGALATLLVVLGCLLLAWAVVRLWRGAQPQPGSIGSRSRSYFALRMRTVPKEVK